MTEYDDHWIETYTGRKFHYLQAQLDPDEIDIRDIAHALSMQCRFGGHVRHFYSVAEHSIRVAEQIEDRDENKLCALLHDASEAYIPDIPRPIKMDMPYAVRDMALMIEESIFSKYTNFTADWGEIKRLDNTLLATEGRDLMDNMDDWAVLPTPLMSIINPYPSPGFAERRFLQKFVEYGGRA